MNQLIDKYIYNVYKDLPKKIKYEVKEELEANIYDMLSDECTYDEVESLLLSLGDPKVLADKYRSESRYVVSPNNYSDYLLSLKLTMIIVSVVFFFVGAIVLLQHTIGQDTHKIVLKVIGGSIGLGLFGLVLSYAAVTFSYQIKSLVINENNNKEWHLDKLDDIPREKSYMINKKTLVLRLVVLLIIGLVGLFILTFYPSIRLFGIDFTFNTTITTIFIPLFVLSLVMLVVKTVLMLKMERINYLSSIYDTVYGIYTGVILIVFILHENLFTEPFYDSINATALLITLIVISSVIGVLMLANIALKWYKTAKNY